LVRPQYRDAEIGDKPVFDLGIRFPAGIVEGVYNQQRTLFRRDGLAKRPDVGSGIDGTKIERMMLTIVGDNRTQPVPVQTHDAACRDLG
jgi:hypothetical protein